MTDQNGAPPAAAARFKRQRRSPGRFLSTFRQSSSASLPKPNVIGGETTPDTSRNGCHRAHHLVGESRPTRQARDMCRTARMRCSHVRAGIREDGSTYDGMVRLAFSEPGRTVHPRFLHLPLRQPQTCWNASSSLRLCSDGAALVGEGRRRPAPLRRCRMPVPTLASAPAPSGPRQDRTYRSEGRWRGPTSRLQARPR